MLMLILGGLATGLALGLTGGGGTLLAVPFLHQGVGLDLAAATSASLAAVAALSLSGAMWRLREGSTKPRLGLLFAGAGWLGAPVGAWLHSRAPESWLLAGFALVVLAVAWRMWRGQSDPPVGVTPHNDGTGPVCRFAADGHLRLTTRCGRRLSLLGFGVGVLSGLVGVGGGFLAVPALVALTGLPLRTAVATSLLVVGLIASAGWASHQMMGHGAPLATTAIFAAAGVVGLIIGSWLVRLIPQTVLRRGFALLLIVVAVINLIPLLRAA
jgi:uncharacterized protein